MSAKISVRIPQQLRANLEAAAAKAGKNLSEYLQDNLPELTKQGMNISFEGEGRKVGEPRREISNIGGRIKSIIADAVETKVYLKTLGISLGDESKPQYPPYPYGQQYPYPYPQQQEKTDVMAMVAQIKALDSLESKTTDPEIKAMLKELKDAQLKTLEPPKQTESSRDRMRELIEMMTFYKMAGQPEEASKVAEVLRTEISKMQSQLHDTERNLLQATSDFKIQNLERQINEIRNAPTELDQIKHLSKLAEEDKAIRAYMNTKLGIKSEEPLTPEKLKAYIESVKIPVGDILKYVYEQMQKRRAPAEPPPPPTPPPTMPPTTMSEMELAQKTGILPQLSKQQPTTFAEEEVQPQPPEEAALPPEEEETPPPPKEEKKPPKPKKGKK